MRHGSPPYSQSIDDEEGGELARRRHGSDSDRASRETESFGNGALTLQPPDLDVQTLRIESDEYAVLTFEITEKEGAGFRDLCCLTQVEMGIVSMIVEGHTNVAIARSRGTSPRTIANQLTVIYQKLGVQSRRELCVRVRADAEVGT